MINQIVVDKIDVCQEYFFIDDEPIYARIIGKGDKYIYDEFIYHFFSYIIGRYPDTGNRIPKGSNNLIEAYKYAREMDIFNPNNQRGIKSEKISEIPQMKNNLKDKIISF